MQVENKQNEPIPRNVTYSATVPDALRPITRTHSQNQLDVEELQQWSIQHKL